MKPDAVRDSIRRIKQVTEKPFGVNLIPTSPDIRETMDILIEEKVRVASFGVGKPDYVIRRAKPAGILSIPTVGSVKQALKAQADGADAVIVQGTEAGGHNSMIGTTVLVPSITGKLDIPVIAAGGFCDARGLLSALALGAEAISMGTRFLVTKESAVSQKVKERYLQAEEKDTVVTPHITGTACRVLSNRLVEELSSVKSAIEHTRESLQAGVEKITRAFVDDDPEMVRSSPARLCG
jgi:NAD(P)H-dependent flavin oxidoreductase YrpB (nitropropane dioxygenase family)